MYMTLRLTLEAGYGGRRMGFYIPLIFQTLPHTVSGNLEKDVDRRG